MSAKTVDLQNTLAVLKAAEEWLSDKSHWTQRTFWRDAGGNPTDTKAEVAATCIHGALMLIASPDGPLYEHIRPYRAALDGAFGRKTATSVNDHHGYTAVMAGLRKAIEKLVEEGQAA